MHAVTNCRATNYKLGEMNFLTVKLKAGRIIPALATTTAAIAGLQTLEVIKVLKQHEDLEFYHDQAGIIRSKADFLDNTENGLCNLDYQPIRRLDRESLQVFPLNNDGQLYGTIQMGTHRFYARYPGKSDELTSAATFTHLWLLEDGQWRISRVISYNHYSPQ